MQLFQITLPKTYIFPRQIQAYAISTEISATDQAHILTKVKTPAVKFAVLNLPPNSQMMTFINFLISKGHSLVFMAGNNYNNSDQTQSDNLESLKVKLKKNCLIQPKKIAPTCYQTIPDIDILYNLDVNLVLLDFSVDGFLSFLKCAHYTDLAGQTSPNEIAQIAERSRNVKWHQMSNNSQMILDGFKLLPPSYPYEPERHDYTKSHIYQTLCQWFASNFDENIISDFRLEVIMATNNANQDIKFLIKNTVIEKNTALSDLRPIITSGRMPDTGRLHSRLNKKYERTKNWPLLLCHINFNLCQNQLGNEIVATLPKIWHHKYDLRQCHLDDLPIINLTSHRVQMPLDIWPEFKDRWFRYTKV